MAGSALVEITGISPFLFFVAVWLSKETFADGGTQPPSPSKLAIRK